MKNTFKILGREYSLAWTMDLKGDLDYSYVISIGLFYKEFVKDSTARLILLPLEYASYQLARYPSGLYAADFIEKDDPDMASFVARMEEFVFERLTKKALEDK